MRLPARAFVIAALGFVAGCGGLQSPISAPSAMTHASAMAPARTIVHHIRTASPSYRVLYSFHRSGNDGEIPYAGLIDVKGMLYGTTTSGGTYGDGAVFSISTAGTEHVLHSFGGLPDGALPYAGLIDAKGTLYGTTFRGGTYGKYGYGTVFSISTAGTEHVLHNFGSGSDGVSPYAGLIDVKGRLYGTTRYGGTYDPSYGGNGTVFSISTAGREHVLHSFGGRPDGAYPDAGLIDVKGALYGTTSGGGAYGNEGSSPYRLGGTVFSVSTAGTEYVLHSFGNASDGNSPYAGLIAAKGTFYGTTSTGGSGCGSYGCGTVFSINTTRKERVLHSFGGDSDGARPHASLIDVKGTLYGTTGDGGRYGLGTVFSISAAGSEHVLHSFGSGSDGNRPYASLIDENGTLYGTTIAGGKHGSGTVFALKP
jgi:uncharacterized repeat protein (TIGR03803 family)